MNQKEEEKKLEKMKKEYNQIPIPPELKGKLEQTIMQAKKENQLEQTMLQSQSENEEEKKMSKNRINIWVKRTSITAAAAVAAIVLLTNSSANMAYALEKIPLIGSIAKVVTFREYKDNQGNYQANIQVPEVKLEQKDGADKENIVASDATKDVNEKIEQYTNRIIADYKKDLEQFGEEGHESVDLSYETISDTETLFSLHLQTTISVGSSDSFSKYYHIDKRTDEVIELKNLFEGDYITIISNEILNQIEQKMKEDENQIYFIDSEDGGDYFTQIKEDQNFYITDNGKLVICFDKYEIAPGYMGEQQFEIPTEIIQSILREKEFIK